jgi:arylsulfatase A-like enzyme
VVLFVLTGWGHCARNLLLANDFHSVVVPGNASWVDAGVWLNAGQTLTIHAGGEVHIGLPTVRRPDSQCVMGPNGAYTFLDDELGQAFPLPAAGAGPAPCYALIGKVGEDGEPFYVGAKISRLAPRSGPLFLGVNDFNHADNAGQFVATVEVNRPLQPVRMRRRVPPGMSGRPVRFAQVVIFYVDGLRPDIVEEMSAMGHAPNITEIFLEGGSQVENSLTVFPSNTITANGSLWTGCFSDRHGLKAQVGFDRQTGRSENYLEATGPVASGLYLERQGADFVLLGARMAAVRATGGAEAAQQFRALHTSDIPPLSRHLVNSGKTYGASVLPIMSDLSPKLWTRYLTDETPYLGTQRADRFIDETNSVYAIEHLLRQQDDVMVVWLPETDTVSHHEFRGQFGMARRTIAEADHMIGEIVGHLRRQERLDKTYLILVSDHGHHGGQFEHLDRFDLVNEFFHRPREVTASGLWVGGGLGLTVRQHRWINQTHNDQPENYVFFEALGDGVARIFLPRGGYGTCDWSGPNAVGTLLRYPVAPNLPPANLFHMLAHLEAHDVRPEKRFPVDLILAKLDESSIVLHHRERGWAVIDRQRHDDGNWVYRYRVVTDVQPTPEGDIVFREAPQAPVDPLCLGPVLPPELHGHYLSEQDWLQLTLATPYPDSVVTMTRHLLWDSRLRPRELRYAPDLVVCAAPGWQFNTFNEPGTAHGHPFHPTMRNTLFVAGPNVRAGAVLSDPARAVDLVPTVLAMVGANFDPRQFDGQPLWALFESQDAPATSLGERRRNENAIVLGGGPHGPPDHFEPRYWHEVDLGAWSAVPYWPRIEYPDQPRTIDRPSHFWDVSNLVVNTLSLAEVSVNRLIDDAATALGSSQPPARTFYRRTQEALETRALTSPIEGDSRWLAEGAQSLHWNKIAVSDYFNVYSTANLTRMDAALDWGQRRIDRLDQWAARGLGLPARGAPLLNGTIDLVQYSVWETRRVGTRIGARVLNEWLLYGVEDSAAWFLNLNRAEPSEVLVSPPPQRLPQAMLRLPPPHWED